MAPLRLWAKSRREHEGEVPSMFLPGHLRDVHISAVNILDATGDDQLLALGLNPNAYRERLRRCVLLAAAVHDLGKANDHFQGMISGHRNIRECPQGLRHEWVTLLILLEIREWLLPVVEGNVIDFAFIEWAVAGHHPAVTHPSPPASSPSGAGTNITLHLGHRDFLTSLEWLACEFKLEHPRLLTERTLDLGTMGQVFPVIKGWSKKARQIWYDLHITEQRLVAAVKNCLVAADVAGSALPAVAPTNPNRWEWISESFADRPTSGELQSIVEHRLAGGTPRVDGVSK